jgi:hypothetical protein
MSRHTTTEKYKPVDERVIYLNSKARVDASNTNIYDCSYDLPQYIFAVNWDEHIEIQLQSFVCKYSFYNVDTDRNADFEISINAGVSYTTKQFPVGNYSTKEIASQFQTLLRSVTADTITVGWDKNLNKLKITPNTVLLSNLYLRFPVNETGYELWGVNIGDTTLEGSGKRSFQVSSVVNTPAGFTGNYFLRIMSIGNEEALFIHADFASNKNMSIEANSNLEKNVFAKVHIIAPFFANIYYSASGMTAYTTRFPDGFATDNTIRIWLTDELGNYMKLQSDYQMVWRILKHKKVEDKQLGMLEKNLQLQALNIVSQKRAKK